MSKAASSSERPPLLLGRPSNSVSMGIVGMPNVGKCFARDTAILMFDGTTQKVQDVRAGQQVMGDDSRPRTVQDGSLIHGTANLYCVQPHCDSAEAFVCNGAHVLVARRKHNGKVVSELTVDDYLKCNDNDRSTLRMYRPSLLTYNPERTNKSLRERIAALTKTEVDDEQVNEIAWAIGLWLAAGLHAQPSFSVDCISAPALERCARIASLFGQSQSLHARTELADIDAAPIQCKTFSSDSIVARILSDLQVLGNKHLSIELVTETVDIRSHILAGLIDGNSDGAKTMNGYTLAAADERVLRSYRQVGLSLGHRVSAVKYNDVTQQYFIHIDGDHIQNLASLLTTQQDIIDDADKDISECSQTWSFSVESIGAGEYFGFAVDGNHRFLLGDLTVTHNSTLFNALSKLNVPAENYPFCTIEPSTAKVPVPDERFDFLVGAFQPKSTISAVLTITDIAGLVKGANEGKGLGNNFLSHISAVDAIYHVVRAFKDKEIEHVEGSVDPVRDLDIISDELVLKDLAMAKNRLETVKKMVEKAADKSKKADVATLTVAVQVLEEKKDIRSHKWTLTDVDVLNELQFLTAKPVVYLVNIGEDEYLQQKNKFIPKIKEWVSKRDPDSRVIPFSAAFEGKVIAMTEQERKTFLAEKKVPTQIPKIITTGYHALDLIHYFTCGPDEVRAWTIKRGTLAPAAAGVIHTDFQKAFIAAETYSYDDFKECGTESAVKAGGKYRTKGKDYVVTDGDIMFFKHNASSLAAKKK